MCPRSEGDQKRGGNERLTHQPRKRGATGGEEKDQGSWEGRGRNARSVYGIGDMEEMEARGIHAARDLGGGRTPDPATAAPEVRCRATAPP